MKFINEDSSDDLVQGILPTSLSRNGTLIIVSIPAILGNRINPGHVVLLEPAPGLVRIPKTSGTETTLISISVT